MKSILQKTIINSKDLFKIMIPIIFIIKVIQEFNALSYFSYLFYPIMWLLDIPQIYSLSWIGALLNNNYTAFSIIAILFNEYPITYEQLTEIALLCLICHSIIVESIISKEIGTTWYWSAGIRFFSSILTAYLFHIVCKKFFLLQSKVDTYVLSQSTHINTFMDYYKVGMFKHNFFIWLQDIGIWILEQIQVMFVIFLIIFIIFAMVKVIHYFNLFAMLNKVLFPLCHMLKINKNNSFILFICFIVGLSYGWGLLKEEKDNNNGFQKDQSFKVITFLAMSHAMIEDILIFTILGANFWLVFIIRLLASVVIVYLLSAFILPSLSNKFKSKYLFSL